LKAPELSINKAIEATRKMYQVVIEQPDNTRKTIEIKKNKIQQKIISIIEESD